jgi:hypothetical protein
MILSLELALSASLFVGGWFLLIRSFECAGDALVFVLDGDKRGWMGVGFFGSV